MLALVRAAKFWQAAFALVLLLGWATESSAAETEMRDDRAIFSLTAEGWIETETAKLYVFVRTAAKEGGRTARGAALTALDELIPGAAWRLTDFQRSIGKAGLAHWRIGAETRRLASEFDNIHEQAKRLSKPGLQISVAGIDFTPTLAEYEALTAKLRAEIYAAARAEMERLNSLFPGRGFRIGQVDFQQGPSTMALTAPPPRRVDYSEKAMAATPPLMAASRRVVVSATVELAAVAPDKVSAAK